MRPTDPTHILRPRFRADGLPLVALPSNPTPRQRPHARARDVLSYHQYLFRTLPLLFPAEHLSFWRDRLCEEAWETEYIFLTISALGGIHRAMLMMSTPSQNDMDRGLDTKIIAVQTYTEVIEQISEREAENSLDLFVGTLVLLAYFEVRCILPTSLTALTLSSASLATSQLQLDIRMKLFTIFNVCSPVTTTNGTRLYLQSPMP